MHIRIMIIMKIGRPGPRAPRVPGLTEKAQTGSWDRETCIFKPPLGLYFKKEIQSTEQSSRMGERS